MHAGGALTTENENKPPVDSDELDLLSSTGTSSSKPQDSKTGSSKSRGDGAWHSAEGVEAPDVSHLSWISLHQDWGHMVLMPEDNTIAVAPEPSRAQLKSVKDALQARDGHDGTMTDNALTGIRNVLAHVRACYI